MKLPLNQRADRSSMARLRRHLNGFVPKILSEFYRAHDGCRPTRELAMRPLPIAEAVGADLGHFEKTLAEGLLGGGDEAGSLAVLFGNDDGDYAALYTSGPLRGRMAILEHDEVVPVPTHLDVARFLEALARSHGELAQDHPRSRPWKDAARRAADQRAAREMRRLYRSAQDDRRRFFYAACLLQLTPASQFACVGRFLDENPVGDLVTRMYVMERYAQLVALDPRASVIPVLGRLAETGWINDTNFCVLELGRRRTPAALRELLRLIPLLPAQLMAFVPDALESHGCKIRKPGNWDDGDWRFDYRLPESRRWISVKPTEVTLEDRARGLRKPA